MFGLGTIINTAFVVFGGLIGLLFKKGIKERYEKFRAMGRFIEK